MPADNETSTAAPSLRERFDHDEPDLPAAKAPQASEMRFDTRDEAKTERIQAISTVIRDLEQDKARLAAEILSIDLMLKALNSVRARWAGQAAI